jgi:hypothetical protein
MLYSTHLPALIGLLVACLDIDFDLVSSVPSEAWTFEVTALVAPPKMTLLSTDFPAR